MDSSGAVVEYRAALSRWAVSAALRHDRNSDFDDVTTYRATASFRATDATRLRFAAGSGQKTPTFIERFGFFSDQFAGNPALRPEESTEWEIGVDQRLTERSRIALTYFNGELRDEINGFVFDPVAGVFTARNESGSSDRRGAELELTSMLGEHVQLRGAYTYTDSTQPSTSGDETELRRPRHTGAVRIGYRPETIPLGLFLNVIRTGSQLDTFFPPFPQPAERVRLDAYVLADLTARYRVGRNVELIGRVENAFDESYEDVFGFATPGRGAYVGLRYSTPRAR